MNSLYEKGILILLVFVRNQHLDKVTLSANWIGMHGRIGDNNNNRKHLHITHNLSNPHFCNLSRFNLSRITVIIEILIAWKIKST